MRTTSYRQNIDTSSDEEEEARETVPEECGGTMVNGPGLDQEEARLPSTSNMASTLFRLKHFKDALKGLGPPNSL